jgi:hypothetical protein
LTKKVPEVPRFFAERRQSCTRFIKSFRDGAIMKTSKLTMAGAGLLLLVTPAWAGHSTPAEREATRQLNLEAARHGQNSNLQSATLQNSSGASTPGFADATAGQPVGSPPAAAPTTPIAIASIESATMANPEGAAPVTLSTVVRPPSKIATANVLDSQGQTIGAVQRVDVAADGTPTKLAVALTGRDEKTVVLDANAVKYDAARNEILAQQSAAQIRSLPRAG